MTHLPYDPNIVETVANTLDLRDPNRDALDTIALALDTAVHGQLLVADLATGVGKTYVAAGLLDYLYASGVRNVVIVTPGSTIQRKTVANLTPGSPKYVRGLQCRPEVITLDDFETGRVGAAMDDPNQMKVFVFTVQSLLRPDTKDARRAHRAHEVLGQSLSDYLREADDLVVIADEHHVYAGTAAKFAGAIAGLEPTALIGLTATPDPSTPPDAIVYHYPLADAIADGYVKIPVLVGRKDAVRDTRLQMADAVALLDAKVSALSAYCAATGKPFITPVLFVVAQTIGEANAIRDTLSQPDLIGDPDQVLLITSEEPEASLEALDRLEHPDSRVRAVVSVSMLKEGWDVRNIYVIASVRAMESQLLTEQVLGRGLRLPFGGRTGHQMLDTVEVLSHQSFEQLLQEAEVLLMQTIGERTAEAETRVVDVDVNADEDGPAADESDDEVSQVEVFLPGRAAAPEVPGQGSLFGDLDDSDNGAAEHQVGGISTMDARLAAAAAEAEALRNPELPRDAGGVRLPWYLPSVRVYSRPKALNLADVNLVDVAALGARYADDNAPTLTRTMVSAHRQDGDVVVDFVDASADAPVAAAQMMLPFGSISEDLAARLMRSNAVAATPAEYAAAASVAEAFLSGAHVDEETTWRVQHSRLATSALVGWLERQRLAAGTEQTVEVSQVGWPDPVNVGRVLGVKPTNRNKVASRRQFVKGHPYNGWVKSVYPSARFDSWSAEFRLAVLLDTSEQVRAWTRITDGVPLRIIYTLGAHQRAYVPDFIAVDADGVWWVAEAKSDAAMTDQVVQAKAAAARDWVRHVNASESVATRWAYLLASEETIGSAASWQALLNAADTYR